MTTVVQPSPVAFGPSPGLPAHQPQSQAHHAPPRSHSPYSQQQLQQNSSQQHQSRPPLPPIPQHAQQSQPPNGGRQTIPSQSSTSNLSTITESASSSSFATPRPAARASFPEQTPTPSVSHAPSAAASFEELAELAAIEFAQETGTPATGLYSQNGLWSDESDEEETRMSWRQRLSNSTAGDRRSVKSSKSNNGGHSHRGSRSKMDSIMSPLSVESPWPWSRKSVSAERRDCTATGPRAIDHQEVLAGEHSGMSSIRGPSRHSGRMSPASSIGSCGPVPHSKHQHTNSMHSISSQHSTVSAAGSVASTADLTIKQRISMGRLRRKSTSKGGYSDFPEVVPAVPQIPAALESAISIRSQQSSSRGSFPGNEKRDLKASASTRADPVNVSAITPSSSSGSLRALVAEGRVHAASASTQPQHMQSPPSGRPPISSPITTPRSQPHPRPHPPPSPTPTRSAPVPKVQPAVLSKPKPTPAPTRAPQPQLITSNRQSVTAPAKKEEKDRPKSFIKRNVERLWRSKSAHGLNGNYDELEQAAAAPPVPELPSTLRKSAMNSSTSSQPPSGRATPAGPATTLGKISSPIANPIAVSAVFPMAAPVASPPMPPSAPPPMSPPPPGAVSPMVTGHSTYSAHTAPVGHVSSGTVSGLPPSSTPAGDELAAHLAALDAKYPSFSASTLGAAGKSTRSFNLIDPDEALETDPFASAFEPPRRPLSRVMSRTSTRTSARDSARDSMLTLDEDVPRPWTPGLSSPSMRSLMPRLYKSKSFASGSRPSSMAMFFSKDKDRDSKLPPTPDLPAHTVVTSPLPVSTTVPGDVVSPRATPSRSPLHISDTGVEDAAAAEEAPVFYDNFDNIPSFPSSAPPVSSSAASEAEEPRSRCGSVTRGEIAQVSRAFPTPPTSTHADTLGRLERLEPVSPQPTAVRPPAQQQMQQTPSAHPSQATSAVQQERIVGPPRGSSSSNASVSMGVSDVPTVTGGGVVVAGAAGGVMPGSPPHALRQDLDHVTGPSGSAPPAPLSLSLSGLGTARHLASMSTSHRPSSNSSSDDLDGDLAPRHSASVSGSSLELRTPHPNTYPDTLASLGLAQPALAKAAADCDSRDLLRDGSPRRPESTGSFQQLYNQLDINPSTLQPIHPYQQGPAADDASFCDPFGISHPGSAFSYKAARTPQTQASSQILSTFSRRSGNEVPAVPFPETENSPSPQLPAPEDYAFPIDIPSQPSSATACDPAADAAADTDADDVEADLATTPSRRKRMAVDYSLQRKGFNPHAANEPESPFSSHGHGMHVPMRSGSRREARDSREGRHEHREAYQRLGSGVPSPAAGMSRERPGSIEPRPRVRSGPEQWIDDMDTSSSENEQDETPLSQLHPAAAQQQQERRARQLARREARRAERERQLRSHKQNQHSDSTLRSSASHWNGEGGVPADMLAGRLENVVISSNGSLAPAAPLRSQRSLRRPHRSSETPSPALSRATTLSSRPSRPSSARPLPVPGDYAHGQAFPHPPSQSHSRPASGSSAPHPTHRPRQRSHSIGAARHPPPQGDVPPLPRGRAQPVRCIVVADEIRQISIDVYHDTIAREILSQLKGKLPAPAPNAAWVVCEVFTERGLERQVRDYENISTIVKGWDATAANCLAIRESALTLARQVPESAPFVGGWCQLETKPGKWSKRWLETRGGQVFLSKNDKGKDEVQLNTLFCDVYRPQQGYAAPQPFVFAIKRLEAAASFEKADEFAFMIASDESTGYKLHTAVYASRSFTIGTGNPAAIAPKSKGLGRSRSMAQRRTEPTLLDVHNAPSPFTGKGLLKHGH